MTPSHRRGCLPKLFGHSVLKLLTKGPKRIESARTSNTPGERATADAIESGNRPL